MTTPTLTRPVIQDTSSWRDAPTDVRVNEVVRHASDAACAMKEGGCEEVQQMVNTTMSQEALNEARNGELGLMAALLSVKLGVE